MLQLLTEGLQSGHKEAATLLPDLPAARALLGYKGYDSGAYRAALIARGISHVFHQEQSENSPQYTVKHI